MLPTGRASLAAPAHLMSLSSGVADVVNAILNSAGSVNDRITALEKLANSISTEYQQSDSSKAISATMNTLIVVLCTGAMTSAAADSRPASTDEAEELTQRVSVQLDTALVLAGDRADDDMYNALLAVRSAFLSTMSERASGLSELLQVTTAQPLPALTLANRLYQMPPVQMNWCRKRAYRIRRLCRQP